MLGRPAALAVTVDLLGRLQEACALYGYITTFYLITIIYKSFAYSRKKRAPVFSFVLHVLKIHPAINSSHLIGYTGLICRSLAIIPCTFIVTLPCFSRFIQPLVDN
jgi:hypothetical protein